MIDLNRKRVFVRTQEEYESVLRIARFQGFSWCRSENSERLIPLKITLPNVLNFHDNKTVSYSSDEKTYDASEIVEDEKMLREAIAHVKYFANNKDRMSLTDKTVDSMLLLADSVENQLEEVK